MFVLPLIALFSVCSRHPSAREVDAVHAAHDGQVWDERQTGGGRQGESRRGILGRVMRRDAKNRYLLHLLPCCTVCERPT